MKTFKTVKTLLALAMFSTISLNAFGAGFNMDQANDAAVQMNAQGENLNARAESASRQASMQAHHDRMAQKAAARAVQAQANAETTARLQENIDRSYSMDDHKKAVSADAAKAQATEMADRVAASERSFTTAPETNKVPGEDPAGKARLDSMKVGQPTPTESVPESVTNLPGPVTDVPFADNKKGGHDHGDRSSRNDRGTGRGGDNAHSHAFGGHGYGHDNSRSEGFGGHSHFH